MKTIYFTILFFLSLNTFALEVTGSIKLLKGSVTVDNINASKGMLILENQEVETGVRSFAKIVFNTGSSIVVGANSKVTISKLDSHGAHILNLVRGKIRADVEKSKRSGEYSMFLKTRTASIGVRGTRFLLTHNESNLVSSVLTFEGAVHEYKKSDTEIRDSLRREGLLEVDSSTISEDFRNNDIQIIKRGEYAGSFPGKEIPTTPVRIDSRQFQLLEKNQNLDFDKETTKRIIVTRELVDQIEKELVPSSNKKEQGVNGGALDIDTGIYISPPSSARYNEETQQYEMPSYFGSVDEKTGQYLPPEGLVLHPTDGFIISSLKKGATLLLELQNKLNEGIDKGIAKFKDLTRTDFDGFANYYYDTNVHENYYGERRNITYTDSMTWDLYGRLAHQTISNQKYSMRPKIFGQLTYHNRRKNAAVKREDLSHIGGGVDFDYFITLFKNKASIGLETNVRTFYKDIRNKNQFDFYNEDLAILPSITFRPTRKNIVKLTYESIWFNGHDGTTSGTYKRYHVSITQLMGQRYDLFYNFSFSNRYDKNTDNNNEAWQNQIILKRKNIFEYFDMNISLGYEKWNSQKTISLKRADLSNLKLFLERKWGHFTKFSLGYEFVKQNTSQGFDRRRFEQNLYHFGVLSNF